MKMMYFSYSGLHGPVFYEIYEFAYSGLHGPVFGLKSMRFHDFPG